jgi:hypothetical protein
MTSGQHCGHLRAASSYSSGPMSLCAILTFSTAQEERETVISSEHWSSGAGLMA